MMKCKLIFLMSLCFCVSLHAAPFEAYFNQNSQTYYTDPYRNITRRGDNLEQVLLDGINSATHSIYIAVQELRLPLVAKALVLKMREGIDVRVVLENNYNKTLQELGEGQFPPGEEEEESGEHAMSRYADLFALIDIDRDGKITKHEMAQRDAIYILRAGGVEIKDDTFDQSNGTGLMHHKFMIIDGVEVIIGSANFTMSGIHGDVLIANSRGNANSMIKVESTEITQFYLEEFLYMWGGPNGTRPVLFGMNKPYRGRLSAKVDEVKTWVQFSPTSRLRMWEDTVNGLITDHLLTARKQIYMGLFVFSDQGISDALNVHFREHKNIDLSVLVERKFAYRYYSELLDMWGLKLLNENCAYEAGNRPWRYRQHLAGVPTLNGGDVLHHKFAVLDGKTLIYGSQNWSDSANYINDESVLVIQDEELAQKFVQEYERLTLNARFGPPRSLVEKIEKTLTQCESEGRNPYFDEI